MICFDTGDLVGKAFLMEEDDDGLRFRACIIEVLDDHKKNVANNPVLKKFKCLVGEDEFEDILSYNEEMQHIEKNNDDGETFWKYKRISGHEGPLNKNHSSSKGDKYNVKVEWENGEVSYEPLHTKASNDPVVVRAIYGKDHGLLDTDDRNVLVSSSSPWDAISFVTKKVSHVSLASTSISSSRHMSACLGQSSRQTRSHLHR
jgi:hypothetical protein